MNYFYFRHTIKLPDTPDIMKACEYECRGGGGYQVHAQRTRLTHITLPLTDVKRSLIGFAVFMTLWVAWIVTFYTQLDSNWTKSLLLFDIREL